MRHKSKLFLMLLSIIIISFPSICFSDSKTVEGEYCEIYLGDMKNKDEWEILRKSVRRNSIKEGIRGLHQYKDFNISDECLSQIISQYLEKIDVISHTEEGRKICEKVRLSLDPEVIEKFYKINSCGVTFYYLPKSSSGEWFEDVGEVLKKKSDKMNIGLIIEIKIPDIEGHKKELLENEEEKQFFNMVQENSEKYKVIDRRHLTQVLEELKLSSSGITDSESVKLGKILNLDIIVLRMIYEKSTATKVLKVDTGEVLLFRTYRTFVR